MKRTPVLACLAIAASISMAVAGSQDAKTVRMQSLGTSDNLYILSGGGGNSVVLTLDSGVVLIDTKLAGWGRPMLDAIRSVTDAPVTTIINTHTHGDHTGGNVDFATVVDIVAHENAKTSMAASEVFRGGGARFLPNKTVTSKLSLLSGLDHIDLYYFGRGHTNGDLVVVFPEKRVAHVGDLFPSKAAPIIDTRNGGSGVEYPETLAKAVAALAGVTTVVTGHTPPPAGSPVRGMTTMKDLAEYADFTRELLGAVRTAFKAGKSADEAAAGLTLPDRFKSYDMGRARQNVQAIYEEMR